MLHNFKIRLARRAYRLAATEARAYSNGRNRHWNVLVQMAYDRAECAAANRLARLLDSRAILRAF